MLMNNNRGFNVILGDSLPKGLSGERYRFDDPEFEIEGLAARSEGNLLYLRAKDGQWIATDAEDIYLVPNAIRKVYGESLSNGNIDRVAQLIVPRIGGIILFHTGIMPSGEKLRKNIYEEDSFIGVRSTSIVSPHMRPGTTVEVRISEELSGGKIYAATADGTELS